MSEPDRLREYLLKFNSDVAEIWARCKSDEELQAVIDGAREWIAGIRWSWLVVASNYILTGEYSAALPKALEIGWVPGREPTPSEFTAWLERMRQAESSLNPMPTVNGGQGLWGWSLPKRET